MACIFCDKPCVFFRNAKRLSNIPPRGGNRRGFGCVYAGHFRRVRMCASACSVPTVSYPDGRSPLPGYIHEKAHTHLFFKTCMVFFA